MHPLVLGPVSQLRAALRCPNAVAGGLSPLGRGVRTVLRPRRGQRSTASFQFGTKWPAFIHAVCNIADPLLAYEVHQPAEVAAMKGMWHTQKGAPTTLFGLPDEAASAC